jgi:hypothetical protein
MSGAGSVTHVPMHRWWHLRSTYTSVEGMLTLTCMTCETVLDHSPDDGYRCEVCGSAYCHPMEHH